MLYKCHNKLMEASFDLRNFFSNIELKWVFRMAIYHNNCMRRSLDAIHRLYYSFSERLAKRTFHKFIFVT